MSEQKQQRILEAAMILFNKHGFHATPTSKIAKKAKVSVGTLFNYFPTKEDLIEAIYVYIKMHSKASLLVEMKVQDNVYDNMYTMWHALVKWGIDNPEEFRYLDLFTHSPLKSSYHREESLAAYKYFREEILSKIVPVTVCDHDPEFVLTYIDNSMDVTVRYVIEHDVEDIEAFLSHSFEMLWNGIKRKSKTKDLHS